MSAFQVKIKYALLFISLIFCACKKPSLPSSPTIISIDVNKGYSGIPVTITGTNFSTNIAEDSVKVNGTPATVTAATTTTLVIIIPSAGTTGPITVKVKDSAIATGPVFTYPTFITSLSPNSGMAGDTVLINGTDFLTSITANSVKFNGVNATVIAATGTKLTVIVPTGVSSGLVTVLTNLSTTLPGLLFTVNPPGTLNWQQVGSLVATGRQQYYAATVGEKIMLGATASSGGPNVVYYSVDGTSFANVSSKLPFATAPTAFYQLTSNGSNFYLSTNQGMATTTDGQTWTLLFDKNTYNVVPTSAVFVNTDMYVCTTNAASGVIAQFYKSTNGGTSWTKISDIPILNLNTSQRGTVVKTSNNTFYAIGGTPVYSGGVYSLQIGKPTISSEVTPYKSTDFGVTWVATASPSAIGNSFGSLQNTLLPVANNLYAIYQTGYFNGANVPANLYRSADGGATWQVQTSSVPTYQLMSGYQVMSANASTLVISDNNLKLDVTKDNGITYTSYAEPTTVYEALAVARSNTYVYLVAYTQVGGTYYQNPIVYRAKLL